MQYTKSIVIFNTSVVAVTYAHLHTRTRISLIQIVIWVVNGALLGFVCCCSHLWPSLVSNVPDPLKRKRDLAMEANPWVLSNFKATYEITD